ncbi:multidrug ABC transporter ATP-binding protein [Phytohabitans aurantiacus]|uniref:Multidrug ABC transporter ATP-binding protein n=1 Tax=Phytohabitans aurantiacus TaxID=3016789 RepID=A0ABQ5R642_9ACTN|nr:multidrug ABC transporter ATP-binding protein [Phytohabitans aurantiacus]
MPYYQVEQGGDVGVLGRAVAGQWRYVAVAAVLGAGHQAGEALVPVVIGVVIDEAVSTGDSNALLFWIAVLAVVFAGLSASWRFAARAAERAAERAGHDVRVGITRRVLMPRGGAETGRLAGALASIATSDARRVGMVNTVLPAGTAALSGILVTAVALLRISVPLGLLVLLAAPPVLWAGHLLGSRLERRSAVEQERAAHASGVAADLVAGLRVLKGIGAEGAAVARYRRTSQESLAATLRAARTQAWHDGALLTLTGVFIAAVALVGGRLAARGDISVGELVAAVGLALFLLGPLQLLAWVNGQVAQGRASAARVADVLAAPPLLSSGNARPHEVLGRVLVNGVTHGPLRDLRLEVAPGELLGVVAADPAAATALLECLARTADPAAGTVELDGIPLSTLDPAEVRVVILPAAHDAELFEGTLSDNVAAAARAGRIPGAMAASAADEVAATLPDGGDTVLAERARSLSGGQRQRVALARALAADPPVLLLHDPTTAVDAVTEARVANGIRELRRGRTTVIVTTSPALLAATDRVVVVTDGAVVAEGRHADLVRSNADYRATVLS